MKDAINYFLPIVQDSINDITGRCITHNVSTNGYYGFQPFAGKEEPIKSQPIVLERMDTNCDMDIQFNNLIEEEELESTQLIPDKRGHVNRKRTCDYDSKVNHKKRREDEMLHNLKSTTNQDRKNLNIEILEDLLRETHGTCSYHWLGHDL